MEGSGSSCSDGVEPDPFSSLKIACSWDLPFEYGFYFYAENNHCHSVCF